MGWCISLIGLIVEMIAWIDPQLQDGNIASYFVDTLNCMAHMVDPLRTVDIVACSGEGSESHCLSLSDEVTKVWAETVRVKRSTSVENW
jgi:hypothetical protein